MREVEEMRVRAGAEAEELPELPVGWAWARLVAITSATLQRVPTEEFLYVDIGSIDSLGHIKEPKQVRPQEAPTRARKDIRDGDTILATTRPYLRKIACVPGYLDGHICSTGFCVLRPNAAVVLPGYVFWVARSDVVMLQVIPRMRGVAYPAVSDDDVRAAWVPLPPLNEQRRIVARLEELLSGLEAGISGLKRALAKLKRYRQAVLKAAVEGELSREWREAHRGQVQPASELLERILKERRTKWEAEQGARGRRNAEYREPQAPRRDDLPPLPEGWIWVALDQLAQVLTGATPRRGERRYYDGGSIPWVTSGALNSPYITTAEEHITEAALSETNAKVVPPRTLLVALYGEGKTRGKVSELLISGATNQACAALVFPTPIALHTQPFVKLSFRKNYDDIRSLASGGVQPNLSLGIIRGMSLPLPPLAEQDYVVSEVGRCLSVAEQLEAVLAANLARSERLRQAILKRAFSGELVPQDPKDEPASVLLERIQAEREKTPAPKRRGRKHVQARPVEEDSDA